MDSEREVVIETTKPADGSVIWLHGLGADGHDFEAIVPELKLAGQLNLRFIFPHAPVRPVTINNGMNMRAWYDILSLDRSAPQDDNGIRASAKLLLDYVEKEHAEGVPYDKILIAGFSQGGAIALHTALRFPHKLAGLLALSTYLPLQSLFAAEVAENSTAQSRDIPIFMAHGTLDPVLPMQLGLDSADRLTTAGYAVDWHEYTMQHSVCAEEIADIRRWLLASFQ